MIGALFGAQQAAGIGVAQAQFQQMDAFNREVALIGGGGRRPLLRGPAADAFVRFSSLNNMLANSRAAAAEAMEEANEKRLRKQVKKAIEQWFAWGTNNS